jgi:methionyl-tRNA formyltransferase
VLAQELVPIGPRDTVGTLYDRLNAVQAEILPRAVNRRLEGDLGRPQDEGDATYCCTRLPDDGEVDWSASTHDIDALVRAVGSPYPLAFTFLGLDRLSIVEAEPSPDRKLFVGRVPGRVVGWSTSEGWSDVLTGDGRSGSGECVWWRRTPRRRCVEELAPDARARSIDLLGRIESLNALIAELSTRTTET